MSTILRTFVLASVLSLPAICFATDVGQVVQLQAKDCDTLANIVLNTQLQRQAGKSKDSTLAEIKGLTTINDKVKEVALNMLPGMYNQVPVEVDGQEIGSTVWTNCRLAHGEYTMTEVE